MRTLSERVAATGQLLMRSGIQIGRLLQAIGDAAAPLSASLESDELLFLSRVLHVDHEAGYLVIACSDVKQANSALLHAPVVVFGCSHDAVRYEFASGNAAEAMHNGRPAICLPLPPTLLALKLQRRARPRLDIPRRTWLSCVVRLGPLGFDALLADITPDGLGALVYDPAIRLEPGAKLPGVQIRLGGRVIRLDVEVLHFTRVPLADGKWAARAGCTVSGAAQDIEGLVAHFLRELEARD